MSRADPLVDALFAFVDADQADRAKEAGRLRVLAINTARRVLGRAVAGSRR